MSTFQYTAWDTQGNCKEGLHRAATEEDVLLYLRNKKLTPVSVEEVVVVDPEIKRESVPYKKVKSADLAAFCWQFGTMLSGGLAITTSIETIAREMPNKYFGYVLEEMAKKLQEGHSLTDCVREYPKIFSNLSVAMIAAGESSGALTATLERLAAHYESKDKLARKVKGALAYPAFVVVFIVVIVIVLMTLIIPRFAEMFAESGAKLPAFTRGFMAVYDVLMKNLPYFLIVAAAGGIGMSVYAKTRTGHRQLCRWLLKTPLLGQILLMAFVAVFCKTLSTLIQAGVGLLDAFEILAGMTSNDHLRDGVLATREKMVEGVSISASMEQVGFFPAVAVKMAQIGENSGSLGPVMEKTSEYYERKVDALVSTMLGLLEPVLIITVGSIVLVVILAMYLPIFSMSL